MRSLAFTFSLLAEKSKEDILNTTTINLTYSTCKIHGICTDCTVCCSCTLKTFIEIHLLSERNYVRDNYIAVSNIINGLMRKLAYQNELRKKRKEAEENKKKAEELKYENEKKNEIEGTVNWPDDLIQLANDWDNLPENQEENISFLKSITDSDIKELSRCNKLLEQNKIIQKIPERINKRQNESVIDSPVMRSTSENYH